MLATMLLNGYVDDFMLWRIVDTYESCAITFF